MIGDRIERLVMTILVLLVSLPLSISKLTARACPASSFECARPSGLL